MVHFSTALSLLALYLSTVVAVPLPDHPSNSISDSNNMNGDRMDHTLSGSPSPTDQVSPSETWSPPAPLPTSGGDNMNHGGDNMNKDGNSMSYGGDNKYGGDSSSYPPSYTNAYNSPPPHGTPPSTYEPSPSPTYGSGSDKWGSKGNPYDDCVQQCRAKFPPPMAPGEEPPSKPSKTHVVWVAPTQGVLRYVPFAVNASIGDTIKFIWGANNHTVTKGSQLTPCNVTADSPFASGRQQKDFVFEQVVNDTNPVFFYCAVPTHCSKGMFGILNPPNALGGPTSVGSMMQSLVAANPDLAMMRTFTDNATSNSTVASQWGTNFDMSAVPEWAQKSFVENVLYTRLFLASNPDAVQNGTIDAGLNGNPPVIPQDITQVSLNNSPGSPDYGYGSNPANPSSVTTTSTVVPTPTSTNASSNLSENGASSATRSGVAVAFAALAAGFFLL